MSELPSPLSAQAQFTNTEGRATREFFSFLQRFLSWASDGAQMTSIEFADLPDATESAGQRYLLTDSNTATFNATVTTTGANIVPVFSNGTNWKVG